MQSSIACSDHPRYSHSFPTRRSSDLDTPFFTQVKAGVRYADRQQIVRNTSWNWGHIGAEWAEPNNAMWLTEDRKSTRLNSSHVAISYAVFCLQKKKRS